MWFQDANGLQEGAGEDYEGYGEYEEGFGSEDDDEQEEAKPSKEELEFLKLREQPKDKIRRKLKQHATDFGHSSQSDDKRTVANDKFGSFFGPSQPIIAARVIEESLSIRETKHIVSKVPSSSSSPSKQVVQRTTLEDRPKKRPTRRDLEDDGDDAINMIRQMFRYNPNEYAGVDDQDSDMEANFDSIMKEERRSAKIAPEEDEEQARLIEEEERRERMRKKQRKLGQR